MLTRRIGGVEVSAIGLGGMPMSLSGRPERDRAIDTIRTALDKGVTLIDTADAYSADDTDFGHNEELIAEALKGVDGVLVATKGGHTRTPDGGWGLDGRPEYLKAACEASLRRLGVDAIGLYQFHRPDPDVPIAESVGALADLLDEGKIRLAGVSNFDPAQIREANDVLGGRLASVQNQ
ncbi:aldo/keto reductase, partial [Saccharothrix sp. MB29]|nr:aldo/keto reductase [Saccharothrix sp. MB29]